MAAKHDPTDEQSELNETASDGVQRLLAKAVDQEGVFAALRWGMKNLDLTYDATPSKVKAQVACRDGCDFCCRVPLGVQAHEVFFAADYIRTHFAQDQIAAVIERARVHRGRVEAAGPLGYWTLPQACALLEGGRCSIYEGRPEICRSHHSRDAQVCSDYLADPSIDLEPIYIPALRRRMFAVMLGIDTAFADNAYDGRAYDFGSALHEALTNNLCAVLWAQKKPAFPSSCLEPEGE